MSRRVPLDLDLYADVVEEAKHRFAVWPSAYASGWVVKTYKERGGKYAGQARGQDTGLTKWFGEEWVDLSRPIHDEDGNLVGYEPCGRKSSDDPADYPKCRPLAEAMQMTPEEVADAIRRKRRAERQAEHVVGRSRAPVMVPTYREDEDMRRNPVELLLLNPAEAVRQNPILLRSDAEALRYGTMVADAYLAAPAFDEAEAWRWQVLIEHIEKLFERIQRGKQGVEVVFVEGQPYADERELQEGVKKTGILYVSTEFNTHPIFTPEQNLKFRAVHDYMTHIARDVTFGLRGEIAAYNGHAKMTPPDAVPALFTEVVGQAATFITKGFFPEQKIVLLPFDYYNVGIEIAESRAVRKNPAELLLLNPAATRPLTMGEVQTVMHALEVPKPWRTRFMQGMDIEWREHGGGIDAHSVGALVIDHLNEDEDYYRRTRQNPAVRIPKGMRPLIEAYGEQIAKLASRVIHEVTGEPLDVQWTPRTEPLGAGSWGVVYPTRDPRFIVKVTADPTEGPIVSTIMSEPQLHNHMGIIHYFALRKLPEDVVFRGKTFPVFVIIAERLKDVGGLRGWSTSREDQHLVRLLIEIKDVAGKLVHEKQKKRPSQRAIDVLDERYLELVGQINDGPLSDFFFQFRDATETGVLADVHLNNLGKRAVDWEAVTNGAVPLSGSDWHWVISDPGHSSVETHPDIAPLRENPRSRR